nr:hypothetical protein HK105_006054 [Polyrhizophydium stewartii]
MAYVEEFAESGAFQGPLCAPVIEFGRDTSHSFGMRASRPSSCATSVVLKSRGRIIVRSKSRIKLRFITKDPVIGSFAGLFAVPDVVLAKKVFTSNRLVHEGRAMEQIAIHLREAFGFGQQDAKTEYSQNER